MAAALVKEVALTKGYLQTDHIDSIYLGGGTPSLLKAEEIDKIFDALREHYTWDATVEITLEANPDDISPQRLEEWLEAGITRLSVGIQSFHDIDLKAMNRAHNAQEAATCLQVARAAGFNDFSIDLIYGAHTTTDDMWHSTVDQALALDVDHISAYCLTVEEGTALAAMVKRGTIAGVDDVKAERQFYHLIDQLSDGGFEHYEISNFARCQRYAVHNTSYWTGKPYLGIGPSAHSYDGHDRRFNIANNAHYLAAIDQDQVPFSMDVLSPADRYHDYLLTSIRTMWGVSLQILQNQHGQYYDHFAHQAQPLLTAGQLIQEGSHVRLHRDARFTADKITIDLMVSGD
jgi:oxygen-independent coproporphyrinogen-3 oxidase